MAQLQRGGTFIIEQNSTEFNWSAEIPGHLSLRDYHYNLEKSEQGYLHVIKDKGRAADDVQDYVNYVVDREGKPSTGEPPTGASTITFPSHVPRHVQSSLARLHQNLGHPSLGDLSRHLKYAGAEASILKAAKSMRCQVCDRNKRTHAPRPSSLPTLLDFNALVSVDVFSVFDAEKKRHSLLSILDHATTFHVVHRLSGHSTEAYEQAFIQARGNTFGAPVTLSADLETGNQAGLTRYAEFHGVRMRRSAGQAHWQQGVVERHQMWYEDIMKRVIDEQTVTSDEIDLAVACVNQAKNQLRRRHGYSPCQAVFGKDPATPEDLLAGKDEERFLEIMTADRKRQREISIRSAARIAFFRSQTDSRLRRALLQRARIKHTAYHIGEMVCFYRIEKVATKRGSWRGPGVIVGSEGPSNWWVSFGGRCHLVAEEHLRPSTAEELNELLSTRVAKEDLDRLLRNDPDDPEVFELEEMEVDPDLAEYSPSEFEENFAYDYPSGDIAMPEVTEDAAPGVPEDHDPEGLLPPQLRGSTEYGPIPRRVRGKRSEKEPYSTLMLKKACAERSREKQFEKELPWRMIPPSEHQGFKLAEQKQIQEHLVNKALTPLSLAESAEVEKTVPAGRILGSRWAYRDKNYSKRRLDPNVEWRPKSRLVVFGPGAVSSFLCPTVAEVANG